ncbi:MAG TPA: hypothetical protein DEB63_06810 [Agrobacterium sp.]|nr:hypothetical protein [Agrobacterium sp.]
MTAYRKEYRWGACLVGAADAMKINQAPSSKPDNAVPLDAENVTQRLALRADGMGLCGQDHDRI